MEVAQNVKKILSQSGYQVIAICTTGAAVLSHIEDLDSGIIVCGSRFVAFSEKDAGRENDC